ncbi:hypothetical protein CPB86DRAFT_877740 [Serendipita vermifera]|nr:hypothetical protein CPB86DRAFT_877740 [Serendipita vermifera]
MSALILRDVSVELSTQDDCFLVDIPHLLLELSVDGKAVDSIGLHARKSSSGVWDADDALVLPGVSSNLMVSVLMQLDKDKRQLLVFMRLDGAEMYKESGKTHEIHLMCHENYTNLILKAYILGKETTQHFASGNLEQSVDGDSAVSKILKQAVDAFHDFENHENLESLEQAIMQLQTAIKIVPQEDKNLPDILHTHWEHVSSRHEMAIELTPIGHDARPMYLKGLGSSLERRFHRLGNLDDLDSAIISKQAAVDLIPEDYPDRAEYLGDLGTSLMTRFNRLGNLIDMQSAVSLAQAAVSLNPDASPSKPARLSNLGYSLESRFNRLGDLIDIENVITSKQAATRFDRLGNLVDIGNAIISGQAAVDLAPKEHPNMPGYLNNLGNSLMARFERLENRIDIDNAVASAQGAVNITPDDHPAKPGRLSNLSNTLTLRFELFQELADIDKAIASSQAAVDLIPEDHPHKVDILDSLGCSLKTRFERLGDAADIERAIASHQAVIDLTPVDHPTKARHLNNLGDAFRARFIRLQHSQDAEAAVYNLSSAATSQLGPPIERFTAASEWCSLASIANHPSLLSSYQCALNLMPLVVWLGLPIADRHRLLVEMGEITREAVSAAISLEQYDKALEWLEQGRSVVWTQILQLRTPVDNLREIKPELAEHLVQISQLLDGGSDQADSAEQEGQQYRTLTAEWEKAVDQVRSLPGFETFLRPPKSSELTRATRNGTVVVLNIAKARCDAFALLPELKDVIHIPLPNITSERVMGLGNELKDLLYSNGIRLRAKRAAKPVEDESDEEGCKQILAELWRDLVKPILDSLAYSPYPDTLPRIWWCVTGSLTFLPIHAAGIYESEHPDDQLSNYAISSYIPTLSSLLRTPGPNVDSTFRLLSVIQPSAPGVSSIPNTREELGCIRRRITNREHIVFEGPDGTKSRLMDEMKNCTWLHLAYHGVQKHDELTKSALILEDRHLTLEEIIRLDLPKAEFAFLSACQTTAGNEKLSEEAVHIAGGMLLAGYRGVVAIMWSIQDDLAPEVADEFYAHIMRDNQRPDSRKAAEALHVSVQKLRKKRSVPLTAWIPFVHLDASVELSTQDDSFLIDIPHLLLELTLDGKTVSSVNLYSRESSLGVWDADKTLVLPESSTNIMLSVIMQLDETERQLLASIGWNGAEMYSKPGRSYEIHLTRHGNFPNLVLKAHALVIENIQDSVSENRQESLDEDNMVKRILKDATKAFYDFENHGNLANLEQAIIQLQNIVERLSIEQENLSEVLDILGLCLLSRFERLGNLTDIQDSIVRHEMAIKLTPDNHDNRPVYFSNLGNSLGKRFDRLGRFADLDRAIVSKQTAVDLTAEDHPNRANYLINLGISLMTRFECFGNRTDMENAIALAREAVSFTPDSDSNKHIFLNTLGQCLNIRFVNTGNLADIEDAIASSQAAVDLAPDGHPDKPNYLNSLGNSLEVRFDRLGNLVDINKAVMTQQAAVDLTPKGHPNMPVFMNSLGTSLTTRFMRLRHRVDLENAVTSLQEAVRLTPDDHPTRPGHLSNLAYALSFSFKGSQKPVDIDKSIELCQDAVDLTPEDHPDKHGYLNNLGCSLRARFDQLGDVADIERAISSYQKASDLIPDDHPARSGRLHNFGQALWARFGYFRQPQDVELAISHLTSAATSPNGSPIDRLVAAAEWYTIAATTDHPSLLSACECALSIMPLVAWPGIGVADRHRFLMEIGEITRDAVAAAISLEQYETALEWLEQGRAG